MIVSGGNMQTELDLVELGNRVLICLDGENNAWGPGDYYWWYTHAVDELQMFECLYINGLCSHLECGEYPYNAPNDYRYQPEPTVEEYCEANGHAYCGDDSPETGRCYCGLQDYPAGGFDESP